MDGWMAIWWMVCGASGRLDTPAVVYACLCFLFLGEEDLRVRLLATFLILPPEQDRVWVLYWVALLE